ncbi:hypothetical protein HJC99_03355 [Candidatus Saccharibacteria bacterium]|nr:hypothetical protein [Candidatus Saccharibacteria bacterium]
MRTSYSLDNPAASGPDSRAFTASVTSPTPSPSASIDQTAPAPAGGILGAKTTPSNPNASGLQAGSVIVPNPTPTPAPTPAPTSYTREEFKNTNPPQGVYYLCGDTYQTTTCDPGLQLVPSNPDPNDTTVQK